MDLSVKIKPIINLFVNNNRFITYKGITLLMTGYSYESDSVSQEFKLSIQGDVFKMELRISQEVHELYGINPSKQISTAYGCTNFFCNRTPVINWEIENGELKIIKI
jgi:hypothetical protein